MLFYNAAHLRPVGKIHGIEAISGEGDSQMRNGECLFVCWLIGMRAIDSARDLHVEVAILQPLTLSRSLALSHSISISATGAFQMAKINRIKILDLIVHS